MEGLYMTNKCRNPSDGVLVPIPSVFLALVAALRKAKGSSWVATRLGAFPDDKPLPLEASRGSG
jgi:hypothetical protein